jgi:hypothetical protein
MGKSRSDSLESFETMLSCSLFLSKAMRRKLAQCYLLDLTLLKFLTLVELSRKAQLSRQSKPIEGGFLVPCLERGESQ